jgi:heptosyltransferase-3
MPDQRPVRRILFITLSNIGDAIMTTPALQLVHEAFPAASVDIVCDPRSHDIFTHCPFRGELILKDKQHGWRGTLQLVRRLRREVYDLIVDLRTDGLARLLRAQRRLTKCRATASRPHAVQQHAAVVAPLAGARLPATRLWLDDAARDKARHWMNELRADDVLAIAPGANWPAKIWPPERFRELADRAADLLDGCVLLGNAEDRPLCAELAAGLKLPHLNLCGKTSLLEAGAVLERCAAFVGNDSGLGHLAAAAGTRTLTVFGPGDPERYHPWGPQSLWVASTDQQMASLASEPAIRALRQLLTSS